MAVQKVTQVFATEATLNETARKEFEVTFDSNSEDNVIAAATANDGASSIPTLGTQFSATYTTYVAQRPIVKRIGLAPLYRVIVPYAVNTVGSGGNKAISPLSRPVEWSSDGQPSTQEIDRNAAGNLIQTSAGQVIVTQVRHADLYIRAVKNLATHTDFSAYFSRTNDANFTVDSSGMNKTFSAETLFLSHVTQDFVEEEYDGTVIQYHRATYHFYANISRATGEPTTWRQKILNQGTFKYDSGSGTAVAITDPIANTVITEPVKLNQSGEVIDPTSSPYWLDDSAGPTQTPTAFVKVYLTATFSGLGL